jgi:DnaJ-class molecular chaperone
MNKKCKRCLLLEELYNNTEKTDRDYFVMTELFVTLHGDKDYCWQELTEDACPYCLGTGKGTMSMDKTKVKVKCHFCGGSGKKRIASVKQPN